ncbi:MAG: hypothetical protein KGM47_16860 [Acidobacteriota bacterium]|nr:hypothetical protein [Acidobacteriota bacterium]
MTVMSHMIIFTVAKVLVGALALVYAGLVLTAYEIEGPHYRPRLQFTRPARSGERLLVWTGVKILDALVRMSRSLFNELVMASGEVGEWVVDKSSPTVQRKVRSRFL